MDIETVTIVVGIVIAVACAASFPWVMTSWFKMVFMSPEPEEPPPPGSLAEVSCEFRRCGRTIREEMFDPWALPLLDRLNRLVSR